MLMKKILNVSEMKQVRGGTQISSMCGEGEKLYTCRTTVGNSTSSGAICSSSQSTAELHVKLNLYAQDASLALDGGARVSCS